METNETPALSAPSRATAAPAYAPVRVCGDCLMYSEYGELPERGDAFASEPAPLALIADGERLSGDYCADHYVRECETRCVNCEGAYGADDDSGHDEFSWAPCQGCGSTLGGDRYRMALWAAGN